MARGQETVAVALALFGGLFHLFNHALFKSLLFLCSGAIEHETGTRQLKELGGIARRMPVTGACCRVAALSISGIPPFNGFWSKLVIVVALAMAGYWTLAVVTVLVSFMTLLSFAKVQRYVLEGEPAQPPVGRRRDAPATMALAMILLAVLCLGVGLAVPQFKKHLADPAVKALSAGQGDLPTYAEQFKAKTAGPVTGEGAQP
jgi:multicomponent Na+:H+ antiporter subunit D